MSKSSINAEAVKLKTGENVEQAIDKIGNIIRTSSNDDLEIVSGRDYIDFHAKYNRMMRMMATTYSAVLFPDTSSIFYFYYLGQPSDRWTTIYSVNALNTSSDERLKKDITPISDELLTAWGENVNWVSYKWIDNDEKTHLGLIAQDVIKAFDAAGLDYKDYNIIDEDEDGIMGVAYSEAEVIENAYHRRFKLGHSYSLEEKLTGDTWLDGRPIYSKTYQEMTAPLNMYSIFGTIEGIAQVISSEGSIVMEDGKEISLQSSHAVNVIRDGEYIQVRTLVIECGIRPITLTVRYVK